MNNIHADAMLREMRHMRSMRRQSLVMRALIFGAWVFFMAVLLQVALDHLK